MRIKQNLVSCNISKLSLTGSMRTCTKMYGPVPVTGTTKDTQELKFFTRYADDIVFTVKENLR